MLYLLLFGIGTSAVPWTINAEIYPMPVRSLCMGIGVACNWTANLLVAYTFLSLEDTISSAGTFWLYGGAAALGTVRLACAWPNPPNPKPSPRAPRAGSRKPNRVHRVPYETLTLTRSRRRIYRTRCGSHARCPRPRGDRSRISSASLHDEQGAARAARA